MYSSKHISKLVGDFNDFLSSSKFSDGSPTIDLTSRITKRLSFESSFATPGNSNVSPRRTVSTPQMSVSYKESLMQQQQAIELLSAKTSITKLEKKVELSETSRKRARIEFDMDAELKQAEQEKKTEKLRGLQQEMSSLLSKLDHYRELALTSEKSVAVNKINYDKKILDLQKEKLQAESKYEEELIGLKKELSDSQASLLKCGHELKISNCEIEHLQEQLKVQRLSKQEALRSMKDADEIKSQLIIANMKIKTLEEKLTGLEDTATLSRLMQSQLSSLPTLQKENTKLKEDNRLLKDGQVNVMLLEEQIESLKNALERSEERCAGFTNMQTENEMLNNRLKEWEKLDKSESSSSPYRLAQHIGDLQNKEATMTLTCGALNTEIKMFQSKTTSLQDKMTTLNESLQLKEKKLHQNSELIKRLQKKLLLISKERDSYHRSLESFENEATNVPGRKSARIESLENLIKGYQAHIEKLEQDLETANKHLIQALHPETKESDQDLKGIQEKVFDLEEQNKNLQEQVVELQKNITQLQNEKETLQLTIDDRVMKGDYDPSKTRVIHMNWNPLGIAQLQKRNELSTLQKENTALHERVRILQAGLQDQADLTARVEMNIENQPSSQEVENLKEQVKASELKNQRLMEAFTEKSQEFREVCYMLTGYRIDMVNTRQYKVISMYAESAEDFLMFQLSRKGELQLLENAFSCQLANLVANYLHTQHSIPAFLSNLTLDLFSQQTAAVSIIVE